MKLILMRHGQAAPYCEDDAGRDLTKFGQEQADQSARQMLKDYKPDLIIASPFNRAEQTAKIILKVAQENQCNPSFITLSSITPDDNPKVAVEDIECIVRNKYADDTDNKCVLVVCHMPIISDMLALLDGMPKVWFELAEYRVLDLQIIAENMGSCLSYFIPAQPT